MGLSVEAVTPGLDGTPMGDTGSYPAGNGLLK